MFSGVAEKALKCKQREAWTCKLCDFYNCLPPEDPLQCNLCKHEEQGPCAFHAGKIQKEDCTNIYCYACKKAYQYADPSFDAPGTLHRLADRAVKVFIKNYGHSLSAEQKNMVKEFEFLTTQDWSEPRTFRELDTVLWEALFEEDEPLFPHLGYMLSYSEEIDEWLTEEEGKQAREEERVVKCLQEIEEDPDTFIVAGSKKGTSYFVNVELEVCTCPGFHFKRYCKHIHMERPKNARQPPKAREAAKAAKAKAAKEDKAAKAKAAKEDKVAKEDKAAKEDKDRENPKRHKKND